MSEVKKGTDHEMEHTSSRKSAKKIAMDHLKKDPNYYSKLEKCMPNESSEMHLSRALLKAKGRQKGLVDKLFHSVRGGEKRSPHEGMKHKDYAKAVRKSYDRQKAAKLGEDMNEDIKGWKNAGRDLSKWRTAEKNSTKWKTHDLKKDGSLSGMATAVTYHDSEDAARGYSDKIKSMNPHLQSRKKLHAVFDPTGKRVDESTVNEVNWLTLANYRNKASKQVSDFADKFSHTKADAKTAGKRVKGLGMVPDAMTRSSAASSKRRKDAAIAKHGTEHGLHQSDNYVMRHYPGKNDDEYAKLKADNKGSGHVLKKYGRLGKDNPNAEKYKSKGGNAYQYISAKDAAHFDVYKRPKPKRYDESALSFIATVLREQIEAVDGLGKGTTTATGKKAVARVEYKKGMTESTEVNEVSKKTLGSYLKKATHSAIKDADDAGYSDAAGKNRAASSFRDSADKRVMGSFRAIDKLTGKAKVNATEATEVKDDQVIAGAKREGKARKKFLELSGAKDNVDDKNKKVDEANTIGQLKSKAKDHWLKGWAHEAGAKEKREKNFRAGRAEPGSAESIAKHDRRAAQHNKARDVAYNLIKKKREAGE